MTGDAGAPSRGPVCKDAFDFGITGATPSRRSGEVFTTFGSRAFAVGAISVGAGPVSRLVFLISNGPTGSFRSNGGAVGVSSSRGKLGAKYLGSAVVGTNCALLTVCLGTATSDRISVTTPYDAPAVRIVIPAKTPVRGQSIGVPPAPIII